MTAKKSKSAYINVHITQPTIIAAAIISTCLTAKITTFQAGFISATIMSQIGVTTRTKEQNQRSRNKTKINERSRAAIKPWRKSTMTGTQAGN
jgi:hypothetical protein